MHVWSFRVKPQSEIWGPAEGGVREGPAQGVGRTHENFEHTPHQNDTPTPQRGIQHWSGARVVLRRVVHGHKKGHEQQIVPRAAPLARFSRTIRISLGTKRFDQKGGQEAVWAKSGAGQMWSENPTQKKRQ